MTIAAIRTWLRWEHGKGVSYNDLYRNSPIIHWATWRYWKVLNSDLYAAIDPKNNSPCWQWQGSDSSCDQGRHTTWHTHNCPLNKIKHGNNLRPDRLKFKKKKKRAMIPPLQWNANFQKLSVVINVNISIDMPLLHKPQTQGTTESHQGWDSNRPTKGAGRCFSLWLNWWRLPCIVSVCNASVCLSCVVDDSSMNSTQHDGYIHSLVFQSNQYLTN